MTAAWLDKQVSNQCAEIEARTLGLPNFAPARSSAQLQGIPDLDGPLDSAYVMFDTGAFDLFNPAHQPFIPPLSQSAARARVRSARRSAAHSGRHPHALQLPASGWAGGKLLHRSV
jgi:hypothetical protein